MLRSAIHDTRSSAIIWKPALKEEYNFSSNEIEDQVTLFKRTEISQDYIAQHQKLVFP